MGKASREKWGRKIQAVMQLASQSKPAISQSPWFESTLLWSCISTSLTFVLAAVALKKGDLRWLLWIAWAGVVYPVWALSQNIGVRPALIKILFFLVGLSLSGWGLYELNRYIYKEIEPIAVSPSEAKLTSMFDPSKRLRGHIDLAVYNRGDDPYYQIWVKIIIESEFLSAETIDVDFPTLEERARAGEEPRAVMVSASCLRGRDQDSKKAFLCVIDALNPKQLFQIKMTSTYNIADISKEQIGRALLKVIRFSSKPGQLFDNFPYKEKGAASQNSIPENFTSTAMIHFCPDIGEPWKFDPKVMSCTPNSKRY